jgi:hypothetical protein
VEDGRLDVLMDTTARAEGDEVTIEFEAGGHTSRFTETVEDSRIRFRHRLPGEQRAARGGIMEIHYEGNERVQPVEIRLRAARHRADLQRTHLSLRDGVLTARGKTSSRARGLTRLRLTYGRPDGTVGEWHGRARIGAEGQWRLTEELPPQARQGGYLTIQYTGYLPRRIRGEQIAKQVLAGQVFN